MGFGKLSSQPMTATPGRETVQTTEVPHACLLLASLLAGLAGFAAFAAAPSTAPLVNKPSDQLGDDDEDVRKEAEKNCGDLGEDVLASLRRAAKQHADVDTRLPRGVARPSRSGCSARSASMRGTRAGSTAWW